VFAVMGGVTDFLRLC